MRPDKSMAPLAAAASPEAYLRPQITVADMDDIAAGVPDDGAATDQRRLSRIGDLKRRQKRPPNLAGSAGGRHLPRESQGAKRY